MTTLPSGHTNQGTGLTEKPPREKDERDPEPRFRAVLEHAPLGIAVTDLDGTIVEANPMLASFLECSPEGLVGRSYTEFTHPEDLTSERRILEELVSGRRDSYRLDKRYRTASGETRWGRLAVSLIRDPRGEPRLALGMVEDVTEQRRIQGVLRSSEANYRHLFETMSQGVVYQDATGEIRVANPAAEEILGLSVDEMRGRTSEDPRWQPLREDGTPFPGREHPAMVALRTGREVRGVVMGIWNPREQGRRWIRIHAVPKFCVDDTLPSEIYTVFEDITELRSLEQRLRHEGEVRKLLVETAPAFFMALGPDGCIRLINQPMLDAIGYQREEAEGKHITFLIPPEDRAEVEVILGHAAATGEKESGENRVLTREGSHLLVEWSGRAVHGANGVVRNFLVFGVDVTERRATEERLAAYQNQLRAMAAELSVVEDRERERFAGELHDSVGQVLALARMKLTSTRNRESDPVLAEVDSLLESAIRQTRSLTFDLSPPVLHELGLRPAVEWLLDETERRHGIATTLSGARLPYDLDERSRNLVFRVLQELVTNAAKHGKPRQIRIHLWVGDGTLRVQVRDDGNGFSSDPGQRPHTSRFGLFSVRERLEAAGGSLEIDSTPGRGTRATITVPLEAGRPARR